MGDQIMKTDTLVDLDKDEMSKKTGIQMSMEDNDQVSDNALDKDSGGSLSVNFQKNNKKIKSENRGRKKVIRDDKIIFKDVSSPMESVETNGNAKHLNLHTESNTINNNITLM